MKTTRPAKAAVCRAPQSSSLSLKKFGAARNVRTEPGEPAGSSGSGGTLNSLSTAERSWVNISALTPFHTRRSRRREEADGPNGGSAPPPHVGGYRLWVFHAKDEITRLRSGRLSLFQGLAQRA